MNNFTITLDGVEHKPGKPKAKTWREFAEFDDCKGELEYNGFIDEHANIIAKTFNNPAVTAEKILENVDLEDILPLYRETHKWLQEQIHSKLNKIPNDQAAVME